jgi:hypothetical protein
MFAEDRISWRTAGERGAHMLILEADRARPRRPWRACADDGSGAVTAICLSIPLRA